MTSARRALAWLLGVLMLALPGCAVADHDTAQPGREILSIAGLRTFSLPLDAYLANKAEIADLSRASNLLFSRCMRQFGFEPQPP